jgi:hypothetical protein
MVKQYEGKNSLNFRKDTPKVTHTTNEYLLDEFNSST